MNDKELTNDELRANVDRAKKMNSVAPSWHWQAIIQLHGIAIKFRNEFAVRCYRHEFMLEQWAKDPDKSRDIMLMYIKDQQRGFLPKLGAEYEAWATEHDAAREWPNTDA